MPIAATASAAAASAGGTTGTGTGTATAAAAAAATSLRFFLWSTGTASVRPVPLNVPIRARSQITGGLHIILCILLVQADREMMLDVTHPFRILEDMVQRRF